LSVLHRFDKALDVLLAEGNRSTIYQQMTESTNDDDLLQYVNHHFTRLQQIAVEQEASQYEEMEGALFLDVLDRGRMRALTAIFRLAFEAGRLDERSEAADLNALLREE
jgi:hypothetical protein